MPPPLIYSQLVIIRVSHESPAVTRNASMVLREELERVVNTWLLAIAEPIRPKMEVLNVGSDDFPFKEIPRC
jgi:hypothetical protein